MLAKQRGFTEEDRRDYDYRENSILDLLSHRIESHEQTVTLDEHFRSRPQIIEFSNREFYGDGLKIMTGHPRNIRDQSVFFRHIKGRRKDNGPNPIEAGALVQEVVEWVQGEKYLEPSICHSIGILSPFRDQVDCIQSLLSTKLESGAVDKHRLLVGTAHSFQGEERDLMFLSFMLDAQSHPSSFRFLDRPGCVQRLDYAGQKSSNDILFPS